MSPSSVVQSLLRQSVTPIRLTSRTFPKGAEPKLTIIRCFRADRTNRSEAGDVVASGVVQSDPQTLPLESETKDPSEHPVLKDERFPPPVGSITPLIKVLSLLGAHVSTGELEAVREDWRYIPEGERDNAFEIILQTFLYGGLPRVINALTAIRMIDRMKAPEKEMERVDYAARGHLLNREIYGPGVQERLRERLTALHPDLDKWLVEIAYGRVLSRAGPGLKVRELCLIAVLAGMHCDQQLKTHMRGALRSGATRVEVESILDQTIWVYGLKAQRAVDATWKQFLAHQATSRTP